MNRRSGFMYSVFAISAIAVIAFVLLQPAPASDRPRGDIQRLDESFYFLESVQIDLERAGTITARRTLAAASNTVLEDDTPLASPAQAIRSAFRNGTMEGEPQLLMADASFEDWQQSVEARAQEAGWSLSVVLNGVTPRPTDPAVVRINTSYNITLRDASTRSRYVRRINENFTLALTNISDPMYLLNTDGRSSRSFQTCDYDFHAQNLTQGTEAYYQDTDMNWTSGPAVVRPLNGDAGGVSNADNKVVIVDDVCAYSDSDIEFVLSDYGGIISEAAGGISADGTTICGGADSSGFTAYIGGATDAANNTTAAQRVVMDEHHVWHNNIIHEIDNECYFDDQDGPDFFDRLEGEFEHGGTSPVGWGSFVSIPDLPPSFQDTSRSAVDHIYFDNGTATVNRRIKGVSDDYSWFRMDTEHITRWDLGALAYD